MIFCEHYTILEKIQLLQRWILVQSVAYYQLNENIASDFQYDANAIQLIELMLENPKEAAQSRYRKYFHDYCPGSDATPCTSGFDLVEKLRKNKKLFNRVSHDAHLALKLKKERLG